MPRKRIVEPWEEELRAKALELKKERDLDIMRTAAIMLVGRRLDEIRAILCAAGLNTQLNGAGVGGAVSGGAASHNQSLVPDRPVHACQECGREAVYRTKPNAFNRTGSWLCRVHLSLKAQYEGKEEKVAAPEALPPPPKPDTGGDVTIADAFAALGVDGSAESVQ